MLIFFLFFLRYFLVTDAGSTSTRMYAYGYDDSISGSPIKLIGRETVRIPLSNAVHDTNAIRNIFSPLLSWAKTIIPKADQSKTDIDVFGTSSMRQLERSEQVTIIKSTRQFLKDDGTFQVDKYACHVLTETEEASYLWIALNTLVGNLPSCKTLIGSIEITSQNANFAANIKSTKNIKDWVTSVVMPTQTFQVFAPVFIGLGIDEVIINLTVSLAAKAGSSEIKSPCFLKGYKNDLQHFIVTGTGSYDQCYNDISEHILNVKSCKKGLSCIFDNVPLVNYEVLYGLSTLFYTRQFFNLSETARISDYVAKGKEFCNKQYSDAVAENPGNEYVSRYCIYTAFIANFLQRGLGVTDKTRLLITDSIDGSELQYTLGVVIASQYKLDYKKNPLRWYEILAVVLLFVGFFGIIIGIIVCCCLKNKKKSLTENEIALLQYQWAESDSSYQRANEGDGDGDVENEVELEKPKIDKYDSPNGDEQSDNRYNTANLDSMMTNLVDDMAGNNIKQSSEIKPAQTNAEKVEENTKKAASKICEPQLKTPESASEKVEKGMGEMADKMGDIKLENSDDRKINRAMKDAANAFTPNLRIKNPEDVPNPETNIVDNQAHPENNPGSEDDHSSSDIEVDNSSN